MSPLFKRGYSADCCINLFHVLHGSVPTCLGCRILSLLAYQTFHFYLIVHERHVCCNPLAAGKICVTTLPVHSFCSSLARMMRII